MEGTARGEEFDGGGWGWPIASDEPVAKTAEQLTGAEVVRERETLMVSELGVQPLHQLVRGCLAMSRTRHYCTRRER